MFAWPGEFKTEPSGEEYDQYAVGKKFMLTSLSLPIPEVKEKALAAMIKRLKRGEGVPMSSPLVHMA